MTDSDSPPYVLVALPNTLVQRLVPGALERAQDTWGHLVDGDERKGLTAIYLGEQVAAEISELEADVLYERGSRR
jgi:hypothetical protein